MCYNANISFAVVTDYVIDQVTSTCNPCTLPYNFNDNFVKGEKLTRAFEFGQSRGFPVVVQCRSGGARMQVLKFLRGSFNSSFKFTNRKARFR